MTAIGRIMAPGAITFLLFGCTTSPAVDYLGNWRGKQDVTISPDTAPDVAYSLAKVELKIDSRGRFALFEQGIPKDGSLVRTSEGAVLRVERIMGSDVERAGPNAVREYSLRPNEDGTLTLTIPRGSTQVQILLSRDSQPRG